VPTLAQLQTRVRDWLSVSSTAALPDSYITDSLNLAVRELVSSYDLLIAEQTKNISGVAGTQAYNLPQLATGGTFARFIVIYAVSPDDATQISVMNQLPYDEFVEKYGLAASIDAGDPIEFTLLGTQILFGPTPSRSITITCKFYEYPADLSAGSDTNAFTADGNPGYPAPWQVILYRAAALCSKFLLDEDRAGVYTEEYQFWLNKYVQDNSRRRYTARQFPQMVEPH